MGELGERVGELRGGGGAGGVGGGEGSVRAVFPWRELQGSWRPPVPAASVKFPKEATCLLPQEAEQGDQSGRLGAIGLLPTDEERRVHFSLFLIQSRKQRAVNRDVNRDAGISRPECTSKSNCSAEGLCGTCGSGPCPGGLALQPWTEHRGRRRPVRSGRERGKRPAWEMDQKKNGTESEQPGPAWKQLRVPPSHGVPRSHTERIRPVFSLALGRQGLETPSAPRRRGPVVRRAEGATPEPCAAASSQLPGQRAETRRLVSPPEQLGAAVLAGRWAVGRPSPGARLSCQIFVSVGNQHLFPPGSPYIPETEPASSLHPLHIPPRAALLRARALFPEPDSP